MAVGSGAAQICAALGAGGGPDLDALSGVQVYLIAVAQRRHIAAVEAGRGDGQRGGGKGRRGYRQRLRGSDGLGLAVLRVGPRQRQGHGAGPGGPAQTQAAGGRAAGGRVAVGSGAAQICAGLGAGGGPDLYAPGGVQIHLIAVAQRRHVAAVEAGRSDGQRGGGKGRGGYRQRLRGGDGLILTVLLVDAGEGQGHGAGPGGPAQGQAAGGRSAGGVVAVGPGAAQAGDVVGPHRDADLHTFGGIQIHPVAVAQRRHVAAV